MLKNITEICGIKLIATDGNIGHAKDFYFDDLTRQHGKGRYHPSSWSVYRNPTGLWGIGAAPVPEPALVVEEKRRSDSVDDAHPRSTRSITGCEIEATAKSIGSASASLVDHEGRAIADLVVETGHWYAGKQILISPASVKRISHEEERTSVKLTREGTHRAPRPFAKSCFLYPDCAMAQPGTRSGDLRIAEAHVKPMKSGLPPRIVTSWTPADRSPPLLESLRFGKLFWQTV